MKSLIKPQVVHLQCEFTIVSPLGKAMEDLEIAICDIETRIGVRVGFFADLANEDDWSFIIKSHALLESSCAEILAEHLGAPETIDIFSNLELSNRKTGKVAFLGALGLLVAREKRFIYALSELRNLLVHNARNTTFCLQEYVAGLDKNQKNNFIESFGYAYLTEDSNGKQYIASPDNVIADPKNSIWLSLKYVLGLISIQIDTIRLRREIVKAQGGICEKVFPNKQVDGALGTDQANSP